MAAVARLVKPGLGRKQGIQSVTQRDAANRLLIENVAIGRAERRRRRDR